MKDTFIICYWQNMEYIWRVNISRSLPWNVVNNREQEERAERERREREAREEEERRKEEEA